MPKAAPETTQCPARAATAATRRPPGRRRSSRCASPTTADAGVQLVEPQRSRAPTGPAGHPPRSWSRARAGRGRARPAGHSASPGHHEPDAPPRGPGELRLGVQGAQASRHVLDHASAGAAVGRRASRRRSSPSSRSRTRTAPSSATRPVSRGSPGSPSLLRATRARRSLVLSAHRPPPVSARAGSGSPVRRAQRGLDLVAPGSVQTPQVRHRPGQPVDPHGSAAADRPAVEVVVEPPPSGLGERPVPGQLVTGHLAVEPPRRCRRTSSPAGPERRRPAPAPARSSRARSNRSPSCLAGRLDVPDDVDPVGDRARRPCGGSRAAPPPRSRTGSSRATGWYSPQGHGLAASTTIPRAGKTAASSPRTTRISPLSSGWRRPSMTSERNSGNSSRKSTPQCARLSSPGPDPAAATAQDARLGRVVVRAPGTAAGW